MLPSSKSLASKPKVYFSHGLLPKYLDLKQMPHAQKPFSTILQTSPVHSLELILPRDLHTSLSPLLNSLPAPIYYLVTVPLFALLEPSFHSTFIKTTNPICMLSRLLPGPESPQYSLNNGILRLELPKELYERAGLQGQPVATRGMNPHVRRRFLIERDLRAPSMAKGKKGFDRLRKACREVLHKPVAWIVCERSITKNIVLSEESMELDGQDDRGKLLLEVLHEYNPEQRTAMPTVTTLDQIDVPDMRPWSSKDFDNVHGENDEAMDLLDWLGNVSVGSHRLNASDDIDSFLSRWKVPNPETATVGDVVKVRWRGFLSGEWVRELLLALVLESKKRRYVWFAMTARSFATVRAEQGLEGYTLLRMRMDDTIEADSRTEGGVEEQRTAIRAEFLLWEMADCINA